MTPHTWERDFVGVINLESQHGDSILDYPRAQSHHQGLIGRRDKEGENIRPLTLIEEMSVITCLPGVIRYQQRQGSFSQKTPEVTC